jgi:hypothetical protein
MAFKEKHPAREQADTFAGFRMGMVLASSSRA